MVLKIIYSIWHFIIAFFEANVVEYRKFKIFVCFIMLYFSCVWIMQCPIYYLNSMCNRYIYGNLQCVLICLLIGYMGYAKDLYDMISHRAIKDTDDDQLYFTNIYLDEKLRVSQCFVISITKVTTSFYCCATVHMSVWV